MNRATIIPAAALLRGLAIALASLILPGAPLAAQSPVIEQRGAVDPAQAQPAGRIQFTVFAGSRMLLVSGVTIVLQGGAAGVTDRRGSVFLSSPTGRISVRFAVPSELLPLRPVDGASSVAYELPDIQVIHERVTTVLLTLGERGELLEAKVLAPKALSAPTPALDSEQSEAIEEPQAAASDNANEVLPALDFGSQEFDDYVVKGRRIRGSLATVMEERRNASSVTDAIGVEDIRKSPDGTASAATRRVVGATVVGGQYLFVRGLGGRYSNVRLNGVPLPSTDPDLPGFQLDLFPASLLSSLTIAKTFTPDIPGDFAGGSMNIETRDFPDHFEVTASASLSGDTQTLGHESLTHNGGDLDFLGLDDGSRALPNQVPGDQLVKLERRGMGLPEERITEIGKAFPSQWALRRAAALPTLGLGFSIGDTLHIAGKRAGYLYTLGYRYADTRYIESLTNVKLEGVGDQQSVAARETLKREVGKVSAQIGMLGTASFEPADGHKLTAVAVLTQTGDDGSAEVGGFGENEGGRIRRTDITYVERQLLFNQLLGSHDLGGLTLDWQLNMANVKRSQPDTRSLIYIDGPGGFSFGSTSGSGERFYTDLSQTDLGGGANVTVPIDKAQLKSGYLGRVSTRGFAGRRFGADFQGMSADRLLAPDALFAAENSGTLWAIDELTEADDGYGTDQTLHAGYGLADLPITDWLRLTGGARIESFQQSIGVQPPLKSLVTDNPAATERTQTDALPAGGAILSLTDKMSVRLAYGGTVARPLVRELAPFVVTDFVRRRDVQGNPDLKRTSIHNFDLRWELFPSATEVLAASAFYKIFQDPIEAIVVNQRGDLTFENIEAARNYGLEFEARASMGRFTEALSDLVVSANFAWIRSRVTLSEAQVMTATSRQRPLAGQSPYVANLSLGYSLPDTGLSLNLFYNVFGRRILEVGRLGLPDSYEEPFHSLDFTASYQLDPHWTVGMSASNLLLQEAVIDQGGFDFSRIDRGTSVGVRLGFVN